MKHDLPWYLNRLHAMSVAEVAHRGYRAARYPIDRVRMRAGRYARPSPAMRAYLAGWHGPELFYFDRELCATPVSSALRDEAEAICAGKRRVLGLGWLEMPPVLWHHEPSARGTWPRVDAARVLHAAPAAFDPRLTWELNRGHEWVVLARVYAATREPRWIDRLERELASWREHDPLGVGINWVSSMEAAIRIHSLAWCAGFLRGTRVLPGIGEMIYEHVRFVAAHYSELSSANNHLIVELSGVIVAARTLGGELAMLHAPALARLTAELEHQLHPDGVSAEMATHYHAFVLEALLLVAYIERAHAQPRFALEAAIERMADYVRAIRCGDGSLLRQGDSDDGCIVALMRPAHADQLVAAAQALRAPRRAAPVTTFEGAFWLTGGTSAPAVAAEPARSRRFMASGQVVLRSRRIHALFDAGPFGFGSLAAHAHCDALSIVLAIDGRRFLVDRGTYRYHDEHERDRYRLTAAHNTVQVGSLEQAAPSGPFLWSRRPTPTIERCELTDAGDLVEASHTGFPGWVHRRTVVHHAGVLAILDELGDRHDSITRAPVARFTSRCHLAPELHVIGEGRAGVRVEHGTTALGWIVSNAAQARVVASPHSDEYAQCTTAATVELEGASDHALLVVIGPADLPVDASIDALAAFAATRGVQLPARELAK